MSSTNENQDQVVELTGRRVTVFGLGRFGGGAGVVRYLAGQGAIVSVADDATEQQLLESKQALNDIQVANWFFECSVADLADTELLIANPAIRPTHPVLEFANRNHVPVSSEIELFCSRNKGTVVAITGSNGKSTTAAMIAHVLNASGRRCYIGGNYGGSLLDKLDEIQPNDVVVLELSSFQLARMRTEVVRPSVAVLTGFAPNHLDWHSSLDDYRRCKQRLFSALPTGGLGVFPADEPEFDGWPCGGEKAYFGSDCGETGVFSADGAIVFQDNNGEDAVRPWGLRVPGEHNIRNSLAAAAACWRIGVEPTTIAASLPSFAGVPMRMQNVGEIDGRTFINDSGSTTPESTVCALSGCSRPMVLIAGGADKGLELRKMAMAAVGRARAAMWVGATARTLSRCAADVNSAFPQQCHESLESAFAAAVDVSKPGDIVILSPGCASFGMYANYKQRGQHFDQLVQRLNQAELSDE